MARWFYSGKVTTPVNIPGRGPSIIQPRMTFEAPDSAVAHLLRLRLVKRVEAAAAKPATVPADPIVKAVPPPPLSPIVPPLPPVERNIEESPRVFSSPDVGSSSSVELPVPAGDSGPEPSQDESQDRDARPRRNVVRRRNSDPSG